MLKLFFAPDTRAVRSAWLMYELELPFEIAQRFSGPGDRGMREESYRKINPNGRVPLLIDGDIKVTESTAIAQYIAAKYGNGRLVPSVDSPEFPVYLQWLHFGEGMLMGPIETYVVETVFLPEERRSEAHVKRAVKLLYSLLQSVEEHMTDRDYLVGDFTVADTITGHACIRCIDLGFDLSEFPNLVAYVDRLKARPAWHKVLSI